MVHGKLSDEEIAARLSIAEGHNGESEATAHNGVGYLSILGPIFGKANLLTQMSGATSLETFNKDLEEMLANDRIHSIVLTIDSPGGTSDGVAETGQLVRDGREIKPIYAIADGMAASAAYWIGSQATDLYTTPSGSVGSIGAYTVHTDQSVADAQSGHKYTFVSAGDYKTEGNPHEPLSAEGVAYRQEVINEIYDDFVSAVADGRGTTMEDVTENYGGGRMVLAKKALETGMIDGITTQKALTGVLGRGNVEYSASSLVTATSSTFGSTYLEHKEMEHSEPGSGTPPLPKTDEMGDDDPAIVNKWRRDEFPPPGFDPQPDNLPKASVVMDELFELYGVEDEPALVAAIRADHEQVVTLSNAVEEATEETRLSNEYPQMWARMQKLESRDREHSADEFVSSVEHVCRAEGDDFVPTGAHLSALAQDTLRDAHMKFAKGEGTLGDFEEAIGVIINGGLVEMTEVGSMREPETLTSYDVNSDDGVKAVQREFAAKISEIQIEQEVDYPTALKAAVVKYPELAAAYKAAVPR